MAIAGSETYRNLEKDPEKKRYPGGAFDPLGEPNGVTALRACGMLLCM